MSKVSRSKSLAYLPVSLLDMSILLFHAYRGKLDEDGVGFVDVDRKFSELMSNLTHDRKYFLKKEVLESALWSCHMFDELGVFWTPNNKDFDTFVSNIIGPNANFDRNYHLITRKEKKSNGTPQSNS